MISHWVCVCVWGGGVGPVGRQIVTVARERKAGAGGGGGRERVTGGYVAWGGMPLFLGPGDPHVRCGAFQLPLYQAPPQ